MRFTGGIWVPGGENSTYESKVTFFSNVIYWSFEGSNPVGWGLHFLVWGLQFFTCVFPYIRNPSFSTLESVQVTGSQRFWPLDVGLNTLTRNSAVLQCKFCPINFLLLTHTQCTFQVLFFRLRLRSGGRFVAISSLSSDLARPSITM